MSLCNRLVKGDVPHNQRCFDLILEENTFCLISFFFKILKAIFVTQNQGLQLVEIALMCTHDLISCSVNDSLNQHYPQTNQLVF